MKKLLMGLFLTFCIGLQASFAQNVNGKVTDIGDGTPIPGVSVVVKGTTTGTITDIEGNYSIKANLNEVLVFSFIGMKTEEVKVSGPVVNLKMSSDLVALDEVVAVGYGTVRKSDLTGSVGSVKAEVIEKTNPATLSQALQGQVSGVNIVSNDGAPGGGVTIRIRGSNTLTGGSQPLFVIDGLPFIPSDDDVDFNPLGDINPGDIESVEILKDASATAIYGAQGANGVVLVTTKRGIKGKNTVKINGYFGLSEVAREIDMMTPIDYAYNMQDRWEARYGNDEALTNPWDKKIEEKVWEGETNKWTDLVMRTAKTYDANVNFSGGKDGLLYAASVGMHDEEGIIIRSNYKRLTGRLNLSQQFNEKVKLSINAAYSKTQNNGMINDWTQSNAIVQALTLNPYVSKDDPLGEQLEDEQSYWGMQNPYTYINDVNFAKDFDKINARFSLDYKIMNGLSFFTAVGGNLEFREFSKFWPSSTRNGLQTNGRVTLENQKFSNWVYEARLNYNKKFGKHKINAVGVFEAKGYERKYLDIESTNLQMESLGLYSISSTSIPTAPSNRYIESSMVSGLGRVNYNFNDRILVTASLRADASSKFGANNKWGYFPSAAVAWRVTQEPFMDNLSKVSNLKLRGSYGVTGNDQIPEYQSLVLLDQTKYNFGESVEVGAYPNRILNSNLKWETTSQYNAGIDLGFFDERISITADWYYKKTTDMLLDRRLELTSGYESGYDNVGEMENKGFELSVNTVNFEGVFSWSTNFNISFNRTNILALSDEYQNFWSRGFARIKDDIMLRVGEPVGVYMGYIQDGVYNTEEEVFNGPDSKISSKAVGEVKFVDVNKDGVIDNNDRVPIAYTQPKHTGGLGNTFKYKGFDLYTFLRWSYGNDVVNGNTTFATMTRISNNVLADLYGEQWTPENPENNYRGYMNQSHENVLRSEYVEDGSFLRLDNVTLGYSLPKSILSTLKLSKLRVYASARNLITRTRYSWYDPEVNTGWGTVAKVGPGADFGSYPRPRTFMFGAEISF